MEMKTFKEFVSLEERFVNALPKDEELKDKYKNEVWNILQKSYKAIGGIKGSGFGSPDDMKKLPMWKMARKNGKIVAVVIYKDKNGRKVVASGTDGSMKGKKAIINMMSAGIRRSYGEKSKASLGLAMKLYPWDVLEPFLKTPEQASKILGDKVISASSVPFKDLPADGQQTLKKYPQLLKYAYMRELGATGNMAFKVMMGTPNLTIR